MQKHAKHGRIGFTTTPKYRQTNPEDLHLFVLSHLHSLCNDFDVLCTGGTYASITELLSRPFANLNEEERSSLAAEARISIDDETAYSQWKNSIQSGLTPMLSSIQGMVDLTYELVEGRLDAVIHLRSWDDVDGALDSMVLRREANVHNVPIILDMHAARAVVSIWKSRAARLPPDASIFPARPQKDNNPLAGLERRHRVLALIAHDGMKLEMCRFAVEHASTIFNRFDYVLSTGTTGGWLQKFMRAAGRSEREVESIRCCLSGPLGGDVQIAAAIIKNLCNKVIFFQDPFVSHPHETDIRLFERIALAEDTEVELATNGEAAELLLGD